MLKHIDEIFRSYKKIIAWGAGNYFDLYHSLLAGRLSYIVDHDRQKAGREQYGLNIYLPKKLKSENPSECLIIIFCNAYEEVFCEIKQYGNFDAIDILSYHALKPLESREPALNGNASDSFLPFLVCAGPEVLWQTNGSNKFITHQNDLLNRMGYDTVEIAPVSYHESYHESYHDGQYPKNCCLAVSYNQSFAGIMRLDEFLQRNRVFRGVIIHSLYREQQMLEPLLEGIMVQTRILYYLHDFHAVCRKRFLYYNGRSCLDEKWNLRCAECKNCAEQAAHTAYHQQLFRRFHMILAAPSESAAQIVHTVYNDIPVIVLPHLQYDVRKHSAVRKNVQNIAYIGLANEYKGWDAFCTIYRQLRQDYQFFCLGKCDKNLRVDGITYVDIGKDKFQNGLSMTEGLKKYGIDIVYIGSTGPETYSYTYFEAFEAGCFVLTYKISGNVSSQVSINKNGKVFASAQEMINWLSDKKGVEQAVNAVHIHIENVRDHDAFMKYFDKN